MVDADIAHDCVACFEIRTPSHADPALPVEPVRRLDRTGCTVPADVVNWARRQALVPELFYANDNAFHGAVATLVESLVHKIEQTGMYGAFWDERREGRAIVSRRPKREVEIQPTLEGLLSDVALAKKPAEPRAGGRSVGRGNLRLRAAFRRRLLGLARTIHERRRL